MEHLNGGINPSYAAKASKLCLMCISSIPILPAIYNPYLKFGPLNASNRVQSDNGDTAQKPMGYEYANTEHDRRFSHPSSPLA
jgi:hypothetical protein